MRQLKFHASPKVISTDIERRVNICITSRQWRLLKTKFLRLRCTSIWYLISAETKELEMTPPEFRTWRERFGLTQHDLGRRLGVSRNTIQNWENGSTALPGMLDQACAVWEDRLKKEMADLGPVTLCYADGPMWVDAYRPRNRLASLQLEPYPTNSAALARVRAIWGKEDVHGPFITEESGGPLWNQVELARVVDGSDNGAPTVRNTIRRLANYILENSRTFVRGMKIPSPAEADAITSTIRKTGEALSQLASESDERCVTYGEFEALLKQLHALGTYPTNRHVSDVAHAIHGEEIVGRWR
jgi:transcriptional regulator with XRE-family HTH domain